MFNRLTMTKHLMLGLLLIGFLALGAGQAWGATANLSWGSRGDAVVQVQQALNRQGYWCGTADGIFGSQTYAAVTRFQHAKGLGADGVVGPQTRAALGLSSVQTSTSQPSRGSRVMYMVATGYDDSWESNYPYYGAPSYIGLPLARGIIAVDPKVIPMGSRMYVEGYGEGIAADQGNAIKGNRIDLFFDSRQEALNWGMRTVRVEVY